MKNILVGDHRWSPGKSNVGASSVPRVILDEGSLLAHYYNKVLKQNPGLIRTPTAHCNRSYLQSLDLLEKIEVIHAASVSTGKAAISNGNHDTLLAGTIGPYLNPEASLRIEEYERVFGESAVYLVDGGVDVLLLEGFTNFLEFQIAVRTMRRLNSVPIPLAAFFKMVPFDVKLFHQVIEFAERIGLELIGFELDIESIEMVPVNLLHEEIALGFQLSWDYNRTLKYPLEKVIDELDRCKPTMLLGGDGTSVEDWKELTGVLSK
ncbi:MAG: hypothetical protein GY786_14920 [Proteobacteria bacterium]|nr:hypothetical protein [Pseudomonadota bacterium]